MSENGKWLHWWKQHPGPKCVSVPRCRSIAVIETSVPSHEESTSLPQHERAMRSHEIRPPWDGSS